VTQEKDGDKRKDVIHRKIQVMQERTVTQGDARRNGGRRQDGDTEKNCDARKVGLLWKGLRVARKNE